MTKTRNVGGKIKETTKGNDTSFAKESIVHNSQKKVTFTSDKGVALDKPKKPETKPDLKVTKIEGPFDKDDKLVKEIERGMPYTYKAISSRKPEDAEVMQLKWAFKDESGNVVAFKSVVAFNIPIGDKVIMRIVLNGIKSGSTVYAYYKESEKAQLEVTFKKEKLPMFILQGSRRKGLDRDNKGTALDMLVNDYLPFESGITKLYAELRDETLNVERQLGVEHANKEAKKKTDKIKDFCKKEVTDQDLFDTFRWKIGTFAMGDLDDVAEAMVNRMQQNTGGEYSNPILTKKAANHENSKKFIAGVENAIKQYLLDNKGVIDALEITDDSSGKLYDILVKNGVNSPRFPDEMGGLGITINDVWAYKVYITKFKKNEKSFEMELQFIYYDHFGLDYPDIQKFNWDLFYVWFVVQHFRGYKPFITKIDFKQAFIGAL